MTIAIRFLVQVFALRLLVPAFGSQSACHRFVVRCVRVCRSLYELLELNREASACSESDDMCRWHWSSNPCVLSLQCLDTNPCRFMRTAVVAIFRHHGAVARRMRWSLSEDEPRSSSAGISSEGPDCQGPTCLLAIRSERSTAVLYRKVRRVGARPVPECSRTMLMSVNPERLRTAIRTRCLENLSKFDIDARV